MIKNLTKGNLVYDKNTFDTHDKQQTSKNEPFMSRPELNWGFLGFVFPLLKYVDTETVIKEKSCLTLQFLSIHWLKNISALSNSLTI